MTIYACYSPMFVSGVSDVCFKCFIWMLHMLLWLHMYISSVCFECFRCFRLMLQVFHFNVAKIDLNVAYVVMAIYTCFKCFIYFRRMLQVFYLDVSKLDLGGAHVAICMVLLLRGSSCRRGSPRAPSGACMWVRNHATCWFWCCMGDRATCWCCWCCMHAYCRCCCVCACGRVKVELGSGGPTHAWAWKSEPFFLQSCDGGGSGAVSRRAIRSNVQTLALSNL
jgi:hypothetical protein